MTTRLKPGDWVRVRSKDEVLATLSGDGTLEGLMFMPEMLQYCGRRLRVFKRAHKSCDYTTPQPFRSRRLERTVLLEARCDGSAHDGCQAGCTLLWKEAWLVPDGEPGAGGGEAVARDTAGDARATHPDASASASASAPAPGRRNDAGSCDERVLWARTRTTDPADGEPRYFCQATQIQAASRPLAWWDIRQYVEDYRSGNFGARRILDALVYSVFYHLSESRLHIGRPLRWFYDRFHRLWGGTRFPRTPGRVPVGTRTPALSLGLQPGERVRVRAHDEILDTVDVNNRNRGMYWDAELVPYCGKTFTVLRQVDKLIQEQDGKMVRMKTPGVILDGAVCGARYSDCRMLCPRAMYPYWREIWLERVDDAGNAVPYPSRNPEPAPGSGRTPR